MKKKIYLPILVVIILSLSIFLVGCKAKPTDKIKIEKPMVTQTEQSCFSWNHIEKAASYIVSIDGVEKNIGLPIFKIPTAEDTFISLVEYKVTDAFAPGKHIIKFAAVKGKLMSEYTEEFFIYKETESSMAAPVISLDGNILSVNSPDGQEFTIEIGEKTVPFVSDGNFAYDLTKTEGLKSGTTYNIRVMAKNGDKVSGYSNVVAYTAKSATLAKPTIILLKTDSTGSSDYQFSFNQTLVNPTLIFAIGSSEFRFDLKDNPDLANKPLDKIVFSDIIDELPSKDFFEWFKPNATLSFKIKDMSLNIVSEYSNGVALDYPESGKNKYIEMAVSRLLTVTKTSSNVITITKDARIKDVSDIYDILVYCNGELVSEVKLGELTSSYDLPTLAGRTVSVILKSKIVAGENKGKEIFTDKDNTQLTQVRGVTLQNNSLIWNRISGIEEYEVTLEIDGVARKEKVSSPSLNLGDINGKRFKATVKAIYGANFGEASSPILFTRAGADIKTSSCIVDKYDRITFSGSSTFTVEYTITKEDKSEQTFTLSTTDFSKDIFKNTLGNSFTIAAHFVGNNIDVLDGMIDTYNMVFVNDITYELINGSGLKFNITDFDVDGKNLSDTTYIKDGIFNVALYEEFGNTSKSSYTITKRVSNIAYVVNAVNTLSKPVTINLNASRCSKPIIDTADITNGEIIWKTRYLENYEYFVDEFDNSSAKENYKVTGKGAQYNFETDATLPAGKYILYVRTIGAGEKFSSEFTKVTFVKYSAIAPKFYQDPETTNGVSYIYWQSQPNAKYVVYDSSYIVLSLPVKTSTSNGNVYDYITLSSYSDNRPAQIVLAGNEITSNMITANISVKKVVINYVHLQDKTYFVNAGEKVPQSLIINEYYNGTLGKFAIDSSSSSTTVWYNSIMATTVDNSHKLITITDGIVCDINGTSRTLNSIVIDTKLPFLAQLPKMQKATNFYYIDETSAEVAITAKTVLPETVSVIYIKPIV